MLLFTVIPSIRLNYESSGLSSTLQNMACGAPIISSYIPALAEIFSEGNDIIFYKPQDPQDLRKKIDLFRSNPELRQKLSISARKKAAEKYNTKSMGEQLYTIINGRQ